MRALWAPWLHAGSECTQLLVRVFPVPGLFPGPWAMTVLIGQTLQNRMGGGSDLWDLMGPYLNVPYGTPGSGLESTEEFCGAS